MPATQAAHVKSAVVVAATRPWPAGHVLVVVAGVHALVLVPAEKLVPATQAAHVKSAVVVAATRPWPAAHVLVVVTGVHALVLVLGE